jgi:hypothetical protein
MMNDNQSKPDPKEPRPLKSEQKTGDALIDAMQVSPCRDIDIEPRRDPMPVREITSAPSQHNRRVGLTTDLPEEWIEAIRRAEVDPRHAHLDEIIKDWKP